MLALLLVLVVADPQPKDAKAVVKAYIEQIERGDAVDSGPLYKVPAPDAINELKPYVVAGSDKVRFHAASAVRLFGVHSNEPALRKEAVRILLEFSGKEKDAGHGRWVLEKLAEFAPTDFDDKAKEQIRDFVRAKDPHGEAFLLAGTAKVEAAKEDLKKWAEGDGEKFLLGDRAWSANLALARMGDPAAAKFCVEKLEAEKDIVQRARRFPDLAYTRHPVAVKYLTQQLMSEERLPGLKAGDPGTKVAMSALDALAKIVDKFPVQSPVGDYNDAQLAAARGWVMDQKNNLTIKP